MKIVITFTDNEVTEIDNVAKRIASTIDAKKAPDISNELLNKNEIKNFKAGTIIRRRGAIEVYLKERFVEKVLTIYTDLIATAVGFVKMFKPRIESLLQDFELIGSDADEKKE